MAGLDELLMQIAAKKRSAPYDPKADELNIIQRYGIPESEMQPDPSNPLYRGWLRNGGTLYHAAPQYPSPAFPWTQISPKIDSHSNMPVVPGRLPQQSSRFAYDELGNKYPGLSSDEALAAYAGRPAEWLNPDFVSSYRPPMAPQPGLSPVISNPADQPFFTRMLNALRGGR